MVISKSVFFKGFLIRVNFNTVLLAKKILPYLMKLE